MNTTETTDARIERHTVPVQDIGKNYAGRYCAVIIDGERIELRVPKGTRGVKAGAMLSVRVEHRDWYKIHRMVFNMREGTSSESVERGQYRDGEHAHYYFDGLETS